MRHSHHFHSHESHRHAAGHRGHHGFGRGGRGEADDARGGRRRRVFDAGRIRYVVSQSRDEDTLSSDLVSELHLLVGSPSTQIETTLLIHPHVLGNFLDYNDFLGVVDQPLEEMSLRGTIQVASFHPQYRFAGTEREAAENYTNRSPYPMLHLLREASVSQATDAPDEVLKIPLRNIETMRNLGQKKILKRLQTLEAEQ